MKDSVDLGTTGQVGGIHLVSRPFNTLLKVHTKLLHHPTHSGNLISDIHRVDTWFISVNLPMCINTNWSRALVFLVGSSGRKFLYSSTSFSSDSIWLCSLLRNPGNVSRMWLVSCWRETSRKNVNFKFTGTETVT